MNEQVKQSVEKIATQAIGDVVRGLVQVEPGSSTSEFKGVGLLTLGMASAIGLQVVDAITLPEWAVVALCVWLPVPVVVYTVCRTWLKGRGVRLPEGQQTGPDAVSVREVVGEAGVAGSGTGA